MTVLFEMGHSLHEPSPIKLPTAADGLELHANELSDDLRGLYLESIHEAKHSIFIVIYSLLDNKIIESLNAKADSGVPVHIVCDAKACLGVQKKSLMRQLFEESQMGSRIKKS